MRKLNSSKTTSPPEPESTTTGTVATKPKRFYGWWILVGAAALSFVAALASLDELASFSEAITDSLLEADPLNRVASYGSILATLVAGLVIAPVVGFLLDRYDPRPVTLFCVLVAGTMLLLITLVQNDLQMHAALWIIRASIFSITSVVLVVTLGKWFVRSRVLAFAIIWACPVFASMFYRDTIFVIDEFGWQTTTIVAGVTFLIVGIPVALMMRRQPEDNALLPGGAREKGDHHNRLRPEIFATARSAIRIPAFWQIALAIGLVPVALTAQPHDISNVVGIYLVRLFDILRISFLALFLATAGIVAVGFISLRLDKRVVLLASFASAIVIYAASIVSHMVDGFSYGLPVFFVLYVISFVAQPAIVFIPFALLADLLGRRNYGVVLGMTIAVHTAVTYLFRSLPFYMSEIGGGELAQFGLGMTALLIAAILVLKVEPQSRVAARIRLLNRRQKRRLTP